MTFIHTMTFSGSIAVVLYMLLYFLTKRHLPVLWHKIYLTIAVFLFITPLPYFKGVVLNTPIKKNSRNIATYTIIKP